MSFEIGLYTVIITVGPSQSGKSTWVEGFKQKVMDKDPGLRTVVLSSDEIRRQLLGVDYHRYAPQMLEASEAAFDLLFAQLEAAIRFPINNEFVVVDTTGLDPDFRRKISEVARENGYRVAIVAFDYPTGDYFTGLSGNDKTIVAKHVETFKKRTLPGIKRKHYDYDFTVKGKNRKHFQDLPINIVDYDLYKRCHLTTENFDPSRPIAIIGDVHEHVFALEMLIHRLPEDTQYIFVGDIVDKGNQTREAIDYVEKMIDKGAKLVCGNHESFVARRLRGQIESITNEDELFPSYKVLKADPELAERFLKMYDQMLPFACIKTHGKTIYVTHAPCYNKSLGKLDERNQKFQRNFYFSARDNDSMMAELEFVGNQAKNSHPLHIFGHVAHSMKTPENKNKVWLDTGAVYGGKLSAFVVYPGGDNKIVSQVADKLTEGKLLYFSKKKVNEEGEKTSDIEVEKKLALEKLNKRETTFTPEVIESFKEAPEISGDLSKSYKKKENTEEYVNELAEKYKLSPEDKYWLHTFNTSGAKFISGTISPSRSTKIALEPVNSALEYFRSKGVDKVILQPKYMGSRLQLYLHRNPEKDFAVTRSGTKSGHMKQLAPIFEKWHEVLDKKDFWKDYIILDGELLPWSAIGRELIDKEFLQYGASIENEIKLLENDSTFMAYQSKIGIDLPIHKKGIETFMEQLDLYGKDYEITYKPFSILSVDNVSWLDHNQLDVFKQLLPQEPYLVVDVKEDGAVEMAESFFESLTQSIKENGMGHEGMVVKPLVFKDGVAPYMKVRNESYLHLIYGYDYKMFYQKMIDNKKIGRKLDLSIEQFNLGKQMLESKTQKELLDLACKMKFKIASESELDPRL